MITYFSQEAAEEKLWQPYENPMNMHVAIQKFMDEVYMESGRRQITLDT